ncbi:hypothetical protein [Salinisphaera sp. Q1T1-3]|uniref:hypothetical protein n=1 Tax=Salinisphaera sp. Q1T1-3 TaxID=2321229 RepID=UPI0011C3EFF8|nr:hypothetical protein [Salinisphaera sp. Q1T1-3]
MARHDRRLAPCRTHGDLSTKRRSHETSTGPRLKRDVAFIVLALGAPVLAVAASPQPDRHGLVGFEHGIPVFVLPSVTVTPETLPETPKTPRVAGTDTSHDRSLSRRLDATGDDPTSDYHAMRVVER